MKFIFVLVVIAALEIWLQEKWIARLKIWRVIQIQKIYGPRSHIETKSATPSMGGVVFLPVALLSIPLTAGLSGGDWVELAGLWFFPIGAACIGFIDDWIKFRMKSSEGFASIYKLAAQILVVVPWAYWTAVYRGISLWPGIELPAWFSVPFMVFLTIGMLNAVNVTDGLDGLAAGACSISLLGALIWLPLEDPVYYAALTGLVLCASFLWHNAHPARVFMGDVGSHFLAGMLISLCVYGDCLLALIPLGFLFGLEIFSVAAQLVAIYGYKRKLFLMSPIHHHFELLGWSETQIVIRFWLVHAAGMTIIAIFIARLFSE